MTTRERWLNSAAGLAVGAVVLVLVTAFFTGVAASINANRSLSGVRTQLSDAKTQRAALAVQLDTLSKDNDALRREVKALHKQNRRLRTQNDRLVTQITLLTNYLRSQGLSVPEAISGGGGSGGSSGSPHRRHHHQAPSPCQLKHPHSFPHACAHKRR